MGGHRDNSVVSLEVPRRSTGESGVSPADRLRPCVTAARCSTATDNSPSARLFDIRRDAMHHEPCPTHSITGS